MISRSSSLALAVLFFICTTSELLAQRQSPILQTIFTVGIVEGESLHNFGRILDLEVDSVGRTYVLDAGNYRIVVLDSAGRVLSAAGGKGAGPGEFAAPITLAWAPTAHLDVFDLAAARITRFLWVKGHLHRVHDLSLPPLARDFCWLGSRLFVLGTINDKIVHELDSNGRIARSFGQPFVTDHELLARMTVDGHIACDQRRGTVLVAPRLLPLLRKYSASGTLLWTARVPDFNPLTITRNSDGSVTYSAENGEHSVIVGLQLLPNDLVLLQVGTTRPNTPTAADVTVVNTFVLDGRTGRLVRRLVRFPRADVLTGRRLCSAINQPIPQVACYHIVEGL